jgi:hypothetical protein
MAFRTSVASDPTLLQESLAHITDVAHVVGARYWLIADDDFDAEWEKAGTLGRKREVEIEDTLPVVFQSHNGRIRIYKIGCDEHSTAQLCP